MKKLINVLIVIIFCVISLAGFSQHLSLNELIKLHKNKTEINEELLYKKGFIFYDSEYDSQNQTTKLTWQNKQNKDEYFIKECSKLFINECDQVTYITSNLSYFNLLKNNLKLSLNKFLYSGTNEAGVLSHNYLIPGPLQATFSTIPLNNGKIKNVYVLVLKKMEFKIEE